MVTKSKKAIAMIELIFALVIMGIVLMSAPMLIQQSIKSTNVAFQQEAIAAAASQTSIVLSMHWDEANANIPVGASPILETNRTNFTFTANTPNGLIGVAGRNSLDGNTTLVPSTLGLDSNESNYTSFDDVDDYDGSHLGLTVFLEPTSSDIGDYVDVDINMSTTINYVDDFVNFTDGNIIDSEITNINNTSLGAISNIKFVTVNLTSDSGVDELNKSITLQAFSCNIGTSMPEGEDEL